MTQAAADPPQLAVAVAVQFLETGWVEGDLPKASVSIGPAHGHDVIAASRQWLPEFPPADGHRNQFHPEAILTEFGMDLLKEYCAIIYKRGSNDEE